MKRLTNILFLLVPLWCLFSYAQTPFDSFAPDFILWICVTVVSLIPYYHFVDGAIFGAEYFNPNSEQTLREQIHNHPIGGILLPSGTSGKLVNGVWMDAGTWGDMGTKNETIKKWGNSVIFKIYGLDVNTGEYIYVTY